VSPGLQTDQLRPVPVDSIPTTIIFFEHDDQYCLTQSTSMNIETGQHISLWSVRIALWCWFLFAMCWLPKNRSPVWLRWTWTLGTAFHVMHVLLAFAYFHDGSHQMAMQHTARRTAEFTGIHWTGGIWFNHLFMLVVVFEAVLWWMTPRNVLNRSRFWNWIIYGFCLFMIGNAGVVFVQGPVRWINLAGLAIVAAVAVRLQIERQRRDTIGGNE